MAAMPSRRRGAGGGVDGGARTARGGGDDANATSGVFETTLRALRCRRLLDRFEAKKKKKVAKTPYSCMGASQQLI
jgi:hypothetical protein